MHAHTIIAAVMALAVGLVTARPANADIYATFYDDNACTSNPGEAVDTANPGCLNESGRNSIYFQSAQLAAYSYSLVFSPSPNCPCQNDCANEIANSNAYCYNLNGHAFAESFRFISGGCGANNC